MADTGELSVMARGRARFYILPSAVLPALATLELEGRLLQRDGEREAAPTSSACRHHDTPRACRPCGHRGT
jgi:hypothetical protein